MLIEGSQSNHPKYRERVVSYTKEHRDRFGWTPEHDQVFREACERMSEDKHPGSKSTLKILSEVYGRNLIVLRKSEKYGLLIERYHPSRQPETKPFHLLYQQDNNFELLLDNEHLLNRSRSTKLPRPSTQKAYSPFRDEEDFSPGSFTTEDVSSPSTVTSKESGMFLSNLCLLISHLPCNALVSIITLHFYTPLQAWRYLGP